MVGAVEFPRPLDGDDVPRVLDDTDDGVVATRIRTDGAELGFRDIETPVAESDAVLHLHDRLSETQGTVPVRLEHVEGDALGRARPDTGQAPELVD